MVLGAIEDAAQPVLGPPGQQEQQITSGDPVETVAGLGPGLRAVVPGLSPAVTAAESATRYHEAIEEPIEESGGDTSSVPSATDLGGQVAQEAVEATPGALAFLLTGQAPDSGGSDDPENGGPGLLTLGAIGAAVIGVVGLLAALAGDW